MFFSYNSIEKGIINNRRQKAIQKLRRLLDKKEPKLIEQLVGFWGLQQNAISYSEIIEILNMGAIGEHFIEEWRQDYAKLINDVMMPEWIDDIREAQEDILTKYPKYNYDPASEHVLKWTKEHSATLITDLTAEQQSAINSIIQRSISMNSVSYQQLSQVIRPLIGLNKRQATANMNYYQRMRENGISHTEAHKKTMRYAGEQHRYRASMIARTEISNAYISGEDLGIKGAQTKGFIGEVNKRWITAQDARVCSACKSINNAEVGLHEKFHTEYGDMDGPTMHPGCRCVISYIETTPPPKQI